MLVTLAPMGLSDRVCKQYKVTCEELELLAIIEEEIAQLVKKNDPDTAGQ